MAFANRSPKDPNALYPELRNPPPQRIKPKVPFTDLLEVHTQAESRDEDPHEQTLVVDIDSLLDGSDYSSQATLLSDEIPPTEQQENNSLLRMPDTSPDFSTAPNILPMPAESSVYLKDQINRLLTGPRDRSKPKSRPKPMTGWQLARLLFFTLFGLFFFLTVCYFFGRWIDGGVMWNIGGHNLLGYGEPAENQYLYHRPKNFDETIRDELKRIRESKRRHRAKMMKERAYRCQTWGDCTKRYWDEMVRNVRRARM